MLFVCENNQYATEVPFQYSGGNPHVANRGPAYGLPSVEVDGNDVLAVYHAAQEGIDRARDGGGATLIECLTYRVRPHAEGMVDFTYRTREEVDDWKRRCPIERLKSVLLGAAEDNGFAEAAKIEAIDEELAEIVRGAALGGRCRPHPEPETAIRHVLSDNGRAKVKADNGLPSASRLERPVPAATPANRDLSFSEATLEDCATRWSMTQRSS